jgi:hypothetical protein
MKNQITLKLWHRLWEDYSTRVGYAQTYQQMITQAGGTVANDHIAFRCLRLVIDSPEGKKNLGIDYLASIIEALGYYAAGEYTFPDQKLYARHYQHPEQDCFDLPKLFISELIVDELPEVIATRIDQTVSGAQLLDTQTIERNIEAASTKSEVEDIAHQLQAVFTRPWLPPKRAVVEAANKVTQYGAWVLLHGYAVNHFTGYINRQRTPQYADIESTARGLVALGVPMKAEIEGSVDCGLRQTATQAVTEMVAVLDDSTGEVTYIPWTYAYYEIAERSLVEVEPGKQVLFAGFLGRNAQNLFEMTRKGD